MSLIGSGLILGLAEIMTQTAVIERDQGARDDLGARAKSDWQPLVTVSCFMWWGTGAVITRMGGIQQRPESTIDMEAGGMIVPAGTDVTARDRIGQVLNADGSVFTSGPVQILAVGPFEGLTELSLRAVS